MPRRPEAAVQGRRSCEARGHPQNPVAIARARDEDELRLGLFASARNDHPQGSEACIAMQMLKLGRRIYAALGWKYPARVLAAWTVERGGELEA